MEIRTKFKVGDKLYVVDCWVERDEFGCIINDECFVKTKPLIVDKILIDRYFIFYGERDAQIGEFIEESHCFATKEKAEQECRRRNGKENLANCSYTWTMHRNLTNRILELDYLIDFIKMKEEQNNGK